jgi:hypothetical protein
MTGEIFSPSAINDKDLELLLESVSFPLTKAEIIHRAEVKGAPPYLLGSLRKLPSRFYHSKNELISQCVVRSVHYSEIGFNIRLDYQTKT